MKIKIKPLAENFKMPVKGSKDSACYDCYATSMRISENGEVVTYGLGFSAEPPKGYSIDLRSRSSISKTGLSLSNSIGTIDNDYRGEFMAKFYAKGVPVEKMYKVGERVCQIKLVKDYGEELELVEGLSDTHRGKGGFGSTGKN
jgi:dUTP pyrophosphatase